MSDPLKDYKFPENEGGGLFLKLSKGDQIKLRVLTTDPLINTDKYGNTRFAFVVYNHTEGKAQILNKGASIARPIQQIHTDEDYGGNIQKIDLKLTATSTGPEDKDVEYSLNPLPKSEKMTDEQLEEAKKIDLPEIIKGGVRMSEAVKNPAKKPEFPEEPKIEDMDDPDSEIDLSEVPF